MSQRTKLNEAVLHECEWKRILLVPRVRRGRARVGVDRVKFGGNPRNSRGLNSFWPDRVVICTLLQADEAHLLEEE
jgi:hypothetical protein